MQKKAAALSLTLIVGAIGPAVAQDEAAAASGLTEKRFYIVPMMSSALTPSDRPQKNGYGGGLVIGKPLLPRLSLELRGDYLKYEGRALQGTTFPATQAPDSEVYGGGLGINLYASPSNTGLYLHGDVEFGKKKSEVYNGGLGIDFRLTENGSFIRAEALYHKEKSQDALPLLKLGVRIPLGAKPVPPEPAPEPVAVVPVEEPAPAPEPAPEPEPAPPPPPPPPPACEAGSLEGCKGGDTLVLKGVTFEFNKAVLEINAKTILNGVADSLLANPGIQFELDGHTDGKGSESYNQTLSEKRAAAVKAYLAGRGVAEDRMTAKGFGESVPVADNNTDDGRAINRRVELKVTDSGGAPVATAEAPAEAPAAEAPAAEPAATEEAAPADAAPAADAPAAETPAEQPAPQ